MAKSRTPAPLPPERLRRRCDPASLPFETTDEIEPQVEIIGQDRAVAAIRLGLDMPAIGYNVFVVGDSGTGRNSTINQFLERVPRDGPAPPDLVYVNNFKESDHPRLLIFPAGRGSRFRAGMNAFIAGLRKHLPTAFESDAYAQARKAVLEGYRERQRAMLKTFEDKIEAAGFKMVQVQMGPIVRPSVVPVIDGAPVEMDQLEEKAESGQFPKEKFEALSVSVEAYGAELEQILRGVRKIDQEAEGRLERLDADVALPMAHDPLAEIRRQFPEEGVDAYLAEVEDDVLASLERLRERPETPEGPPGTPTPDPYLEYRVNLVVDNAETKGSPVVNEAAPTHKNLFGAIERTMDRSGEWRSHFTQIKAGSFLRSNGGYLVLNAAEVLTEPGVWVAMKRALRTGMVEIQSYDPVFMLATSVLKPEPIPTRVKVLMVGGHEIYATLLALDSDFRKIFKVKAEFDVEMKADTEAVLSYARFIRKIVRDEGLLPFDRTGVAAVVEAGYREAGRASRLSTRFTEIADLLREASLAATRTKRPRVTAAEVRAAIAGRRDRMALAQVKMTETIAEGRIIIATTGQTIGQVNGLSVYDTGDHVFGLPTRITATVAMGRTGIVNIERESDLSGPTHNKGVLILAGYLRAMFAQDKPLTLSASLAFEQSYGGVDGDSASSTEIYALLSALAGAPIRQRFAVTGSINQKGEIQPIGGVNQKIEGWFAVCKAKGLTGDQGVLIPALNADDLVLDEEVVEAVRAGRFAVYPVTRVEEGIELLTGLPAGVRDADGRFPEGSIYARAEAQLAGLAEGIRQFGPETPPESRIY